MACYTQKVVQTLDARIQEEALFSRLFVAASRYSFGQGATRVAARNVQHFGKERILRVSPVMEISEVPPSR